MCDIRSGRPTETRAALDQLLIDACVALFGLDRLWIKVEFTQHTGDEMYYPELGHRAGAGFTVLRAYR